MGSLHRHLVFPLDVVPFFFICPAQIGHRGRLVVTGKFNQLTTYHMQVPFRRIEQKQGRISPNSLFSPYLNKLTSVYSETETRFLLLNPQKSRVLRGLISHGLGI